MRNNRSFSESHRKPENSKMEVPSYNNGKRPSVLLYIILIAMTLTAIAVTIFLGKKNYRETIRLTTEQFNQQQLILARSAAKGIETFIADVDDDLFALSNFPVVQRMEPGILERMEVLYQGIPPQTSSRRLDKNGMLRFIYPNEGWRKDLTGWDYSHETWFQKAKKTGEVVISGLIINEAGERRIRVVRPVYVEDEKGTREFNGVIKCSINPEIMANLYISPVVSGDTGYAWLLNEQGIFLAHHEEDFVGRDAFKVRAKINPGLSYDEIHQIQRQMMAGKEGVSRYISGWHRAEKEEIENLIAYTPVHVFDKIWSVVVCAPVDEVERITSKACRNLLYAVGIVILILTAAGAFSFIAIYRRARILEKEIEIRKQAQARIVHLNAVLRAVRNVNQLITKVKDRKRLLQGACDNLIKTRGYNSAWIALIEGDGRFITAAQAGFGDDFPAMVDGLKRGELTRCTRQAFDKSDVVVVSDPAVECGDCPLVGIYAGKARLIARLEHEGRIYGFIIVTVSVGMAVDEEERCLFEEVADDIAFAMHNMELEEKRKQAEEALRKSEEQFRLITENTSDFITIQKLDLKASYTYLSPSVKALTGYEAEELLGRSAFEFIHPEDKKRLFPLLKKYVGYKLKNLITGKKSDFTETVELRFKVKSGNWRYFQSTGNIIGDQLLFVSRDITERKQAEEAQKESEKNLQILIDAMPDFVCFKDGDGRWLKANDASIRIFQLEGLDYRGKKDSELSGLNSHLRGAFLTCKESDERAWKESRLIHGEETIFEPDGSVRVYDVAKAPIFYPSGERKGIVVLGHDITERKQAEEEIRKLSSAVEQSIDGIAICDLEPKLTYVNDAFARAHGYSPEEMIGKKFVDLLKKQEPDKYTNGFNKVKDLGFWTCEIEHIKKDGTPFPAFMSLNLLKDAEGRATGILAVVKDITEQKKLEAQFRQAQKMEAIGTLAGGVAHDFNNILTTIIGNASLALMGVGSDGTLREEIEEIRIAGERAAALTRQLLAFSRKQIIKPKVLDLNEILSGTKKMVGRLLSEDVELLTILEPALWQVEVDPGQVEQVIMNMVVNARDAMPMGGKLTVETANANLDENYFRDHGIKDQPGSYVMLAISDNGSGMDKETLKHIFDPFYTTKEVGKGTGLGLSTVYGIVKQNNGFIWVYSEPGEGTTFKVYLPKVKGNAELEEKEQTPVLELGGSGTVLIVEDDDSLRKLAETVLKQRGYKVLEAENGEDALKISKEYDGSIHLLITDVVMPKMGGKEVAERLQPLYPQMKVIYMSGYTDNAIVHHGVLAPGLNFIEKPFTLEGLARKVREVLDQGN